MRCLLAAGLARSAISAKIVNRLDFFPNGRSAKLNAVPVQLVVRLTIPAVQTTERLISSTLVRLGSAA